MAGVEIPTTVEQGFDVTLANWRLLVAPGGITDAEKSELESIVRETVTTPQWRKAIERYNWNENVVTGEKLATFLDEEKTRIQGLYKELGL